MAKIVTLKDKDDVTLYPQISAESLSGQTDSEPTTNSENLITSGGVKSFIDGVTQTLNYADFSINGYVDATGYIARASSFKRTDYISVLPGEYIAGRVYFSFIEDEPIHTTSYISFYNASKVLVQNLVSTETGMRSFITRVPSDCYYAIICTKTSNLFESYAVFSDTAVISKLNDMSLEISRLEDDIYTGAYIIINGNFNIGGYLDTEGVIHNTAATSWVVTDYIEITPASEIVADLAGQLNTTLLAAFYDEFQNFISGIAPTLDGEVEHITPSVPAKAKYVIFCTRGNAVIPSSQVYARVQNPNFATRDEYDAIASEVVRIDRLTPAYGHNLHKPFNFSGKRAAFFGDSVTYGVNSDSGGVHTDRMNCYRKYLCDIAGMTGSNYAVSGSCICDPENAETSITNKILDTINESSNFDFIFIAGGVNDYATGSPVGTLSSSTYETFYGSLKLICTHLSAALTGKNTQVIFLTPINYSRIRAIPNVADLNTYRNAIFEVATMYGFNVLDASVIGFPAEYTDTPFKQAVIYDGVHPTIAGHKMMAHNIYSLLI